MTKRVALLVIHTNSYFANLHPVAKLLASSGAWEPRFLFASWYPTVARDQARCRAEGFACDGDFTDERPTHHPIVNSVLARVRDTAAFALGRLVATMRVLRASLREHRVALLLLPADNRYDLAAYVKAAHDEQVPVVAIPAFMAAATEWAQFVHGDPAHQVERVPARVAAALYPRWTLDWDGRTLLALPPGEIIARQLLGLAPPQPWTLHSGRADAIALESEAMRRYCFSEGLPARQLVLTGSIDHDLMYARLADATALREATYRRLGMPPGRPMALTALPPDWLYGRGRKECDFRDYRELVRFWLETLVATGRWNVIVSLHPSVKRETMAFVEDWGVKIADDHVSAFIPLCELYLASVSATIQWAIACAIPVINYDVYRFRYPDYLGVEGVINTEEQATYAASIQRFAGAEHVREDLRAKQARGAKYWGILDGRAGARLLELFEQLTAPTARQAARA